MVYILLLILIAFSNYPVVWLYPRLTRKQINVETIDRSQLAREIRNAVITTPVHALLLGAAFYTEFYNNQESLITAAYTFVIAFTWTEIWHYFSHRLMHLRPLFFIHKEHHRSRHTNLLTAHSFSFGEKLIFSLGIVIPMSFLSHAMPLSFTGLCLYYLFYFVAGTIGHSNLDGAEEVFQKTIIGKIFSNPAYHAKHHYQVHRNYGLFTKVLDRAFGTAEESIREHNGH